MIDWASFSNAQCTAAAAAVADLQQQVLAAQSNTIGEPSFEGMSAAFQILADEVDRGIADLKARGDRYKALLEEQKK